jgi:thiol-disulfide isomerase/thioredoxin
MKAERYDFANDVEVLDDIAKMKLLIVVFGAAWEEKTISVLNAIFYEILKDDSSGEVNFRYVFIEVQKVGPEGKAGMYANFESKERFGIKTYPTLVAFREGKEIERREVADGKDEREELYGILKKLLSPQS